MEALNALFEVLGRSVLTNSGHTPWQMVVTGAACCSSLAAVCEPKGQIMFTAPFPPFPLRSSLSPLPI